MDNQIFNEAETTLVTVADWLRFGVTLFQRAELSYGHGSENACDEVASLLSHVLVCPPTALTEWHEAKLLPSERAAIIDLFRKRVEERIPAAYLTQKTYFANLPFYVDERVLIPRSPIAELISSRFSTWIVPEKVTAILDMCTGSACIAIACAEAFPNAMVDAVDLSLDALSVAEINVEAYDLSSRLTLIHSDLYTNCPAQRYDLIVSNPPYVSDDVWSNLPEEYHAEPKMGFTSDDEGLAITKRLLAESRRYLSDNGLLVIEVGYNYQGLIEAYPDIPFVFAEFERGGEGVVILTAQDLDNYAALFEGK